MNATRSLLADKGGAGLSVEAIARRAKVGKPTIYRWWPTLGDIVLEALLDQAETDIPVQQFDSLRQTLGAFLRLSMKAINKGAGVHLRYLMGQAQQDEGFRKRFQEHFTAKRRDTLRSIFQKAVERGELHPDLNTDILVDMIFGAMWYRLLTGHASLDERFADELNELAITLTGTS